MTLTYKELEQVNKTIKTTDIKGKQYAEVPQRVKAFRMLYPAGRISTNILSIENGVVIMQATVSDGEGNVLATGYAYEKEGSTFINKTSYIENAETSAVGRALGFAGFGIDTSIASAEEVTNAINNQEKPKYQKTKVVVDDQGREKTVVLISIQQMEILNDLYKEYPEKLQNRLNKMGLTKLQDMYSKDAEKLITEIMEKKQNG